MVPASITACSILQREGGLPPQMPRRGSLYQFTGPWLQTRAAPVLTRLRTLSVPLSYLLSSWRYNFGKKEFMCAHFAPSFPEARPKSTGGHFARRRQYPLLHSGALREGDKFGVTNHTDHFPCAAQFLFSWMCHFFPGASWTSIAVSAESLDVHADHKNEPSTLNHTISVGPFHGGSLWLSDAKGHTFRLDPSTGRELPGVTVCTHMEPFSFDGSQPHATCEWSGQRWALTAYTVVGFADAPAQVRDKLQRLGVPFPCQSVSSSIVECVTPESQRPPARQVMMSTGSLRCRGIPLGSSRVVLGDSTHDSTRSVQASLAFDPPLACTTPRPPPITAPDLASRLRAARPVVWRGAGDLPQFSWAAPFKGAWLVLDLWSGFGGLCLALLALGIHFWALSAECDEQAAACAKTVMPSIVHTPRVEDISMEVLRPFLAKRKIRGIIVGGGSPCQPHSRLNPRRKGLQDCRADQPVFLRNLLQSLRAAPECEDLEIIGFLENVIPEPDSLQCYSSWMGCAPVLIEACRCGWVSRRRAFWVSSSCRALAPAACKPPACWT